MSLERVPEILDFDRLADAVEPVDAVKVIDIAEFQVAGAAHQDLRLYVGEQTVDLAATEPIPLDVKTPQPAEAAVAENELNTTAKKTAASRSARSQRNRQGKEESVSEDILKVYMDGTGKFKLLTKDDEAHLNYLVVAAQEARARLRETASLGAKLNPSTKRRLNQIIRQGDEASTVFAESNLRLVVSVAKGYQNRGLALLDLIQEGNLGLLHAIEKFDATKGFKFSTYATWWIRQSIGRAIENKSTTIRLPSHVRVKIRQIILTQARLKGVLGRQPTIAEIAETEEIGLTEAEVTELLQRDTEPMSLNEPIGEDGNTEIGDLVFDVTAETPDEAAFKNILTGEIAKLLVNLSDFNRKLIILRYGLDIGQPRAQREVAAILGITTEKVRRLEKESLNKLYYVGRDRQLRDFLH